MLDNQSLVVIFLTCVDTGSFAAAGRKLNVSRSSIGKAVRRLEDDLGVRLFHRSTRHQSLAEEGLIFLEPARRSQEALVAARQIFASGRKVPSGILRVSTPSSLGRHCIGPLLLDMVAEHVDLKLALSLADRPIDLIDEGYDLSIRVGATVDTIGIISRKIGTQIMELYAAPTYLAEHGTPQTIEDLNNHQVLAYSRDRTLMAGFSARQGDERSCSSKTEKIHLDDLDFLADTAARGMGIADLPQWLAGSYVRYGALIQLNSLGV